MERRRSADWAHSFHADGVQIASLGCILGFTRGRWYYQCGDDPRQIKSWQFWVIRCAARVGGSGNLRVDLDCSSAWELWALGGRP